MKVKHILISYILSSLVQSPVHAQERTNSTCAGKLSPRPVCTWKVGTLAIYNGTPSLRLKLKGVKKLLAVGPAEDEWMPDELKQKVTPETAISAKFLLCPLPKKERQLMSMVCIDAVKELQQ